MKDPVGKPAVIGTHSTARVDGMALVGLDTAGLAVLECPNMKAVKWTQEMRMDLYSRLMREFGPHKAWGAKIEPKGKKQEFNKVLTELAKQFSEKAGKVIEDTAVHQQINFATTTQGELTNRGHIRQFILNKAAALEAGFIESSYLPTYMNIRTEPQSGSLDEFKEFF